MIVSASTAERASESLPKIESRVFEHEPAADRPVLLQEEAERTVFGRVAALGQIVGADADDCRG